MESVKRSLLLLAAAALVRCAPQSGPQGQYLPPDQQGYNYNRPSVPFPPPPPPRPQPPPPPPQPQRPAPPPPPPPPPPPQPQRPAPPPPPPPPPPQPQPSVPTGPGYPTGPAQPQRPSNDEHQHDHVHMPGMPYDFNYAVKDDYHGNDFSRNEVSDGDVVRGEYRVQLPDGRLQIVRYTADWATGFHADVTYEGEAQYPPPSEYKRPQTFPPQQQQQQQPQQQQQQQQQPPTGPEGYEYNAPPGASF